MNSNKFLTHWKGRPLKTLNRDEVIDALQEVYGWYTDEQAYRLKHSGNRGLSDHFVA